MNCSKRRATVFWLFLIVTGAFCAGSVVAAGEPDIVSGKELQIEVTPRGLGKQVVISQGAKEWFMLIDVTPENAVVVRQEKDHDRYLVDESETHDRPMTSGEVDTAIADYVNSVKTRANKQ